MDHRERQLALQVEARDDLVFAWVPKQRGEFFQSVFVDGAGPLVDEILDGAMQLRVDHHSPIWWR